MLRPLWAWAWRRWPGAGVDAAVAFFLCTTAGFSVVVVVGVARLLKVIAGANIVVGVGAAWADVVAADATI